MGRKEGTRQLMGEFGLSPDPELILIICGKKKRISEEIVILPPMPGKRTGK